MKKEISSNSFPLVPKFKFLGLSLLIPGIIFAIIRFYYGIKLEIFNVTVFSFYSSYLETKTFQLITNNIGEEVPGILILVGLIILVFSKEKKENNNVLSLRFRSLVIAFFINSCFLLFSFLFVFGIGFVKILIINIYSPFIIYLIVFYFLLYRYRDDINNKQL